MTDANIYLKGMGGSALGTASTCPIYVQASSSTVSTFVLPPKVEYVYLPSETIEKIVYKYIDVDCECGWCRLKRWVSNGYKRLFKG